MRIATWNLERAMPHTPQAERQKRWIDYISADIWVLTETDVDLSPGANYCQVSSDVADRPARTGERWVQIWARNATVNALPTADRARTACAHVQFDNGYRCLVYGTVLPWLESSWRSHPAEGGAAFKAALELQQADWQTLWAAYPDADLILAGDFNQDLNDLPYYGTRRNKEILRQSLEDSRLDCLTKGEHDPIGRITDGQHANIDHICLAQSSNLQFQASFVWPHDLDALRGLSDHFGVGVDLTLA
jgi:hypothetical protein